MIDGNMEHDGEEEIDILIDPETQDSETLALVAGDTNAARTKALFLNDDHDADKNCILIIKKPSTFLSKSLFYIVLFIAGWGCNAFLVSIQSIERKDFSHLTTLPPPGPRLPEEQVNMTAGTLELSHEPEHHNNDTHNNTYAIEDDNIILPDPIHPPEGPQEEDENTGVTGDQDLYREYNIAENYTYTNQNHNENTSSASHTLKSHTYSNCPLTMAKFSQFELGREGPFESDIDRLTNSFDRGKMALDFSNEYRTYDRVVAALQEGAFKNRTIVMEGDSLTRQLFISLSCMIWSAGYVDRYHTDQNEVELGGSNTIMNNVHYEASSKFIGSGSVHLKGGGQIYYVGNPEDKKILETEVNVACNPTTKPGMKTKYQVRYNFDWRMKGFRPMSKNDLHILAAGHHKERHTFLEAYEQMFRCTSDETNANKFESIPHMMYHLSSVESFWTTNGLYYTEFLKDSDRMTCRAYSEASNHRDEERDAFRGLVPLIGDTIDLEHLGQLHVWHGDCLHWLQPGIPDLYAAEVADYLSSTKP